jgi:DNA invertase Pin-like site-specific DNA recombinase
VSETRIAIAVLSASSLTVPGMASYRYGYGRVSTAEQNADLQRDALHAVGVDEGRVFIDTASGALSSRPRLDELLPLLRPGDTLVVWRLDRLGRSLAHLVATVTELGERGVGFMSLTEAIDTTTAAGRLLFGIMASLAQFERDLIQERTHAGLAAARARGRVGGRPAIMSAEKLAVARRMLAEGKPKSVVAKTIGVSRPTLYSHLAR